MTEPLPAQNSTLSADRLATWVARAYDLGAPVRCRFWRKGICDTYEVVAPERRAFLKVYRHGRRSRLDVMEEVRLLRHLSAHGIPVAAPIPQHDGAAVTALAAPEGTRMAALFVAAEGAPHDMDDMVQIGVLGETVARLHACADTLPGPYRRAPLDLSHLLDDNLVPIATLMAHRPDDLALIQDIAQDCRASLSLPCVAPVWGICHGDLHGGDLLVDADGRSTLYDFDSSGMGWRALELGVFLASDDWMNVSPAAEDSRQRRLGALLAGYARVRALSADELDAIQRTPAIRHIFLMGHVLRWTAVHQGWHWADDGFVDWHMAWFRHWAERAST